MAFVPCRLTSTDAWRYFFKNNILIVAIYMNVLSSAAHIIASISDFQSLLE